MTWLTSLLLALLPATHCARFLESVRLWLVEILGFLIDPETRDFFAFTPADLALLETNLTDAENLLRLAVGVRVCELNGWSKRGLRRQGGRSCDPNPTPQRLMARLERCADLLANFEAHAARRAHELSGAVANMFRSALSSASPAQAGAQTPRAKLAEAAAEAEAFGRSFLKRPGSRPAPGMRWMEPRSLTPARGRPLAQPS